MQTAFGRIVAFSTMVFLALVCAFPVCAQDQSSTTNSADDQKNLARIAGTAVRAGTDEPLRKARVVLVFKDSQEEKDFYAVTAADGKFVFDELVPGAYELVVRHDGYVSKSYGEDSAGHGSATLTLAAGQKMEDLIFRLQKCAVITGHVTDEDGDPEQEVTVEAVIRRPHQANQIPAARAETNDLGEYRLFDLLPGRYYVCATPRFVTKSEARALDAVSGSKAQPASRHVVTCYPGAPDISRASAIELKAGDEIPGLNITFLRHRTYKIRGTLTDLSTSNDAAGHRILAMPTSGITGRSWSSQAVVDPKDGSFEISELAPGTYDLLAFTFNSVRPDQAFTRVEIIDADLDSVKIVMKPGDDLHGRIAMEGKAALPPTLKIALIAKPDAPLGGDNAGPKVDGTFELRNVHDGAYAIVARSECEECYLKSARLNGVDLLDKGLQIAGAVSQPLELVYSSRSGTVDGTVTKADDLPAVGATVVLLADPAHREWVQPYKDGTTDQYGKFTIRGVAPGSYSAFAFKNAEDADEIEDPEFLKPIEAQGISVAIDENGKQTVQLKLIAVDAENSAK